DFHLLRKKLLATAVPFYKEFVEQRGDDAKLLADQGMAYFKLARLRAEMGENAEAQADYRQAIEILTELARLHPTAPEYRSNLALNQNNLGNLLNARGEDKEAETAYRQALAIREQLAQDFPTIPEYRSNLATSYNNLGNLLYAREEAEKAETAYRQ